ncbi:hypothetical protein IVA93_02870 [Bradyrhizobium sp. 155]|uniref:GAP1-N1 domain-containing protein n=1 Tax=Bradyrhizobium sp. 155 TaxID=2782629 RepID=UPI001FFF4826|nr:hypothetical protein [Bradyrhizobium sp. 155]UPK12183.1 hypothetical protein IVA93_02870 [Bradyrhizobium sp. 155]
MKGFAVQQTLHGYGEGHRLLAGSVSLPPRDMRTMLILSDSSGSGVKLPADGYLTGYPLAESAKYVLARTWPAPEMKRPGCVWTHSVIIDFADVAALCSASTIVRLFMRPEAEPRDMYERALTIVDTTPPERGRLDPEIAAELVGALYGSPNSKIVGGLDVGLNEEIVLRTWMQQWPRLRRSFRFCTFTATDRSSPSEPFDLQVVANASSIPKLRVANLVSPDETSRMPELGPLVEDLLDPDVDGLRRFLRESGVEVSEGRGAMRPLCTIFAFVGGRMPTAETALDALDRLDRSRASTARRRIVRRLAQDIGSVSDSSFRMVVDEVRADREFDEALAARVGAELWRREPASFVGTLAEPIPLSAATNAALREMEAGELVRGISRDPTVASEIARRREDLLVIEEFWTIPGIDIEKIVASCEDRSEGVVSSLMSSGASVSRSAIQQFQARPIIRALEKSGSGLGRDRVEPWLRAVRDQIHDLIGALRHRELKFAPSMSELSNASGPDDVSCDERGDPWLDAASAPAGELTAEEDAHLCAFLLARGLGRQSNHPAALMRLSLGKVHRALALDRMPQDGWRLLRNRLSFVMPWQEWDRCWRVRSAVAAKFVDGNLDTADFVNLVDDPELWWQVASDVSHVWGGWKYLKQVQRRLETDSARDPGGRKTAALERLL